MGKAKEFIKNKKTSIIRIAIAILIIAILSVAFYFILKALGVTDAANLQKIIESTGAWGVVIFLLLQIAVTTLLSFVPGTSMVFIIVGVALYGANWKAYLICFSGIILSSIAMDLIGRFGGSRLIKFLIGKEEYESAFALLQEKGAVYIPVMYLLPAFPDDAICMVCGAMKIKFWVHLLDIILFRGVGCATIVFGINVLPQELVDSANWNWTFFSQHLWDYFEMITVILFWVIILFYVARQVDKWLTKKLKLGKKKTEENKNDQ